MIGRFLKINLNKHIFLGISHKILGMSNCFFQDSRYAVAFFRYRIRPKIPYCDMSGEVGANTKSCDCVGVILWSGGRVKKISEL